MKKMLKNQKGFSLVELLIVIAIMGILAALAFSMFSGIFSSTERRADDRTADQIAKVLTAYVVETGDTGLVKLTDNHASFTTEYTNADGTDPGFTWTAQLDGSADVSGNQITQEIVEALQYIISIENDNTNRQVEYGPYLAPREGDVVEWENYAPTWDGHEEGYLIEVYSNLQKVDVVPVSKETPASGAETGVFYR
ncbi:type II secretion system protein [Herbivorax sp. ANBcel31]|uniref:type II secretion system protein n=1 Tax=Herbivorax sp. ANBcel31 TaxID=3069754 RepID=UPI0027B310B2|nr:type II secretion system protein [Herbivorax sp. ANBcel31]MDQ2085842.1 type II secretion system protein [Herbivorax sp. ANBcel31]